MAYDNLYLLIRNGPRLAACLILSLMQVDQVVFTCWCEFGDPDKCVFFPCLLCYCVSIFLFFSKHNLCLFLSLLESLYCFCFYLGKFCIQRKKSGYIYHLSRVSESQTVKIRWVHNLTFRNCHILWSQTVLCSISPTLNFCIEVVFLHWWCFSFSIVNKIP